MTCDENEEEEPFRDFNSESNEQRYEIMASIHTGHDWRRMFDEEIECDITIDVDGMLIKAHKSVLTSRCQYFAAMFSGKSRDTINVMYLDGFSFECVHHALCHIYSGNMPVPLTIDIFELADLADLLCLEGLKELVTRILEYDYFHKFHRPCNDCSFLISKFLPWSGAIGYSDLYYKILFWIKQYSEEIWAKKEFALLPYDIIKKCFLHHTLDMDAENVLEMIRCCERLMHALPKVAWTANIFRFTLRSLRECVRYIKANLADVLSTESFLFLGTASNITIYRLEDCMTAAIERANPLQVCAAYARLHYLLKTKSTQSTSEWRNLLKRLTIHCEDALICCASQAMCTSAWVSLQPDLQARIQKSSGIMTTSTYSKYIQSANKYTRERNVERIKYILYSRLGEINRVPAAISRQHLSASIISKQIFVAPGNSMVSSTKTNNFNNPKNLQSVVPASHNSTYKDIKSRYMNPKPARASIENVTVLNKTAVTAVKNLPQNKLSKKPADNVSNDDKKLCKKRPESFNIKENIDSPKKNTYNHSVELISNLSLSHKQLLTKKVKCCDSVVGRQTKSAHLYKEKNALISYVSPYSFRNLESNKAQKSTSQQLCVTKVSDKPNKEHSKSLLTLADQNKQLSCSVYVKKSALDDILLSTDNKKDYKALSRSTFNKSPVLKRQSNENSSSYSSPVNRISYKSSTAIKKESQISNTVRTLLPKEQKPKAFIAKDKIQSLSKSTVSYNAKIVKKSIYESKIKHDTNLRSIPAKANKSAPEVNIRSDSSKMAVSDIASSNDNSITFFLERSRTFVKSEPSIISKEITMDASIEMYPE